MLVISKEYNMAKESRQMSVIKEQLAIVRADIERLRVKEETLVDLLRELSGEPAPIEKRPRMRSPNVKPIVLDYMHEVAQRGASTAEVDEHVKTKIPTVAKETVGSVLSRLKADGALTFDGERYYEKKFSPTSNPVERQFRVI